MYHYICEIVIIPKLRKCVGMLKIDNHHFSRMAFEEPNNFVQLIFQLEGVHAVHQEELRWCIWIDEGSIWVLLMASGHSHVQIANSAHQLFRQVSSLRNTPSVQAYEGNIGNVVQVVRVGRNLRFGAYSVGARIVGS